MVKNGIYAANRYTWTGGIKFSTINRGKDIGNHNNDEVAVRYALDDFFSN